MSSLGLGLLDKSVTPAVATKALTERHRNGLIPLMVRAAALACSLFFCAAVFFCAAAAAMVGGAAPAADGAGRSIVMITSSRGNLCTGTALAHDLVLTAAHCVAPAATYVV